MLFLSVVAVILAYLIGSINFAVIFSAVFMKKDVRELGSGNAGTSGTYTYKVNLVSETKSTSAASASTSSQSNRLYPVSLDKNGKLAVNVPWTDTNDDTKVTSEENHYTPSATTTDLTADATGGSASWNTSVVSGVNLQRDSKGHIVGVTVDSVKIPSKPTDNDTKNTAGATDTSSKIFLVGATSQGANPQTYSHDTAYVGTDGCLYSNKTKVKVVQTAVSDPTASGNATAFIDTISQDANGVITATKKDVRSATTGQTGVVKLNNTVTSTSTSEAGTAKAVKTAYDKGAEALTAANSKWTAVDATTSVKGIVTLQEGDLSGIKSTSSGVAASSYHTHSQYLTSHQDM